VAVSIPWTGTSKVVVMAARPGRVIAEVEIDGSGERDDRFRVSPRFVEACKYLSELLAEANAQGEEASAATGGATR